MTRMFDASTGHGAPAEDEDAPTPLEAEEVFEGAGSLAMLGEAVSDRAEIEPEIVEVPGVPIRLVCSTDIPSKKLSSWQRRALPPRMRNSSQISPFMMDQSIFHAAVLVNTCERVEVKRKGTEDDWRTITSASGDLLTLTDKAVWEQLGALDSAGVIKKLFPRDSDLAHAGQQVLDAAGWTENRMYGTDDEDADPTN
ncbi:hypothetical protein [Actinophytocola sp.]|uniref:hypothetical protein n=1 Tax=Actinophytocola sp. TaxID=1872138 RepID=UPI002D7E8A92|nr:hypothetical protein [Actinophytocola sp.]HET9144153.1 hypothetical protein [Actinophytocola sp.]